MVRFCYFAIFAVHPVSTPGVERVSAKLDHFHFSSNNNNNSYVRAVTYYVHEVLTDNDVRAPEFSVLSKQRERTTITRFLVHAFIREVIS